jgi:hypothetical protein
VGNHVFNGLLVRPDCSLRLNERAGENQLCFATRISFNSAAAVWLRSGDWGAGRFDTVTL